MSQSFYHWGVPLGTCALQPYRNTRTRGVVSLSTAPGGQPEVIDPKAIAEGRGDDYMLSLNNSVADSKQIVNIGFFPTPSVSFAAPSTGRSTSRSRRSTRTGHCIERPA